jgi:hypothetical protein
MANIPLPDLFSTRAFVDEFAKIAKGEEREPTGVKVDPEEISDLLISYLIENPNPSDKEVHEWAEEMGVDVHDVEAGFYHLATRFTSLFAEGKSANAHLDINALVDEIKMGMDVESEHTKDPALQMKITCDHLVEHPQYYSRFLKPMEKVMEEDLKGMKGKK